MSRMSPTEMARQLGGGLLSFPVTHFDEQHQFLEAPYREHCGWMLERDSPACSPLAARASSSRCAPRRSVRSFAPLSPRRTAGYP